MQRAAGAPQASPSSAAAPAHVSSPNSRTPNRQKQAHGGNATDDTPLQLDDAAAARAALAEVEAKRQRALDRHMKDGAETKWAFSYHAKEAPPRQEEFRVEKVGYEGLGPSSARRESGRFTFGNFKRKREHKVGGFLEVSGCSSSNLMFYVIAMLNGERCDLSASAKS